MDLINLSLLYYCLYTLFPPTQAYHGHSPTTLGPKDEHGGVTSSHSTEPSSNSRHLDNIEGRDDPEISASSTAGSVSEVKGGPSAARNRAKSNEASHGNAGAHSFILNRAVSMINMVYPELNAPMMGPSFVSTDGEVVGEEAPVNETKERLKLEDLVFNNKSCKVQAALTKFLDVTTSNNKLYNNIKYNKLLSECKGFEKFKGPICKKVSANSPICDNKPLLASIKNFLKASICATEATFNQLLMPNGSGNFAFIALTSKIKELERDKNLNKLYKDEKLLLEKFLPLFHDAELTLVSKNVQHILETRWVVLSKIFCAIATRRNNPITNNITVENNLYSIRVNVDEYLNKAVSAFMEVYEPFVDLLLSLETLLMDELVRVSDASHDHKIDVVMNAIKDQFRPTVSAETLNPLKDVTSGALDPSTANKLSESMPDSASLLELHNLSLRHAAKSLGLNLLQRNETTKPSRKLNSITNMDEQLLQRTDVINNAKHDISHRLSPLAAIRNILLPLGIFKLNGDHLEPILDETAVNNLVRSALLDLNDEELLGRLVLGPQMAIRVIYSVIDQLIVSPGVDERISKPDVGLSAKLSALVRPLGDVYELLGGTLGNGNRNGNANNNSKPSLVESVSFTSPKFSEITSGRDGSPGTSAGPAASLVQRSNEYPRQEHELNQGPVNHFNLVSIASGPKIMDGKGDEYVDTSVIKLTELNLLHINGINLWRGMELSMLVVAAATLILTL